MSDERLRAAVAAGVLGGEGLHRALLQSIVEVARAIFRAKASSIFLLDEAADELVFEAVAGEGEDALVGERLPAARASPAGCSPRGSRSSSRTSSRDPRFARGRRRVHRLRAEAR